MPSRADAEEQAATPSAPQTTIEWRFDEPGKWRGWTPNSHVADGTVRDGALRGKASGSDPILLGPVFQLTATPDQVIEIEMTASAEGTGQLFWTHTLQGRYDGFDGARCINFSCRGDGQQHVYRLRPYWHPMKRIIRLRFDPPSDGQFTVRAIRIVEGTARESTDAQAWHFDGGIGGWQAWRDMGRPSAVEGVLSATSEGTSPLLMSPAIRVPAEENSVVSIRMATSAGTQGRVVCVSSGKAGFSEARFALRPDGQMHWYDVDLIDLPHWRDEIIALGIQPTDEVGAEVKIDAIRISDRAESPPELAVRWFGQEEGVNRVGRPAGVVCTLRNTGGKNAEKVALRLSVESGAKIVGSDEKTLRRVRRELPKTIRWEIEPTGPGDVVVSVAIDSDNAPPVAARAKVRFTAAPPIKATGYVPQPRPVKSVCDVGVFYFPGWATMSRWHPIFDFPDRKPVLGWYDEANPEVADWQIKWAVEHGVTFFMVDWYWSKGHRHLEHWLHDAYAKARYRKYLKWAVMWANHNAPGSHSAEDWREVTQYWIDNYFGTEEYYRIDGKPAVFMWAPRNIRRDVGGSPQAAELYALSQAMARKAGYKGITFVAMSSHESPAAAEELEKEGYWGTTSYHGFGLAARQSESRRFPFADVVETSRQVWEEEDERSGPLEYIPIVDTGWSSEPWHGPRARVIHDRTPELFGQLCRNARAYAEKTGKRIVAVGPWNEWGEGSYIEPYARYGFADLAQMRAAFCAAGQWPPNVVPGDVGLGPYDLPRLKPTTAWTFDTDGDWEGWSPNGHVKAQSGDGAISGVTTGHDPVLHGPRVLVDTEDFRKVVIRMKADKPDRAQLFWRTSIRPESERSSLRFDVKGDGAYHEYRLDVGAQRAWRGIVTALRFDPAGREGVRFSVDSIRFE